MRRHLFLTGSGQSPGIRSAGQNSRKEQTACSTPARGALQSDRMGWVGIPSTTPSDNREGNRNPQAGGVGVGRWGLRTPMLCCSLHGCGYTAFPLRPGQKHIGSTHLTVYCQAQGACQVTRLARIRRVTNATHRPTLCFGSFLQRQKNFPEFCGVSRRRPDLRNINFRKV